VIRSTKIASVTASIFAAAGTLAIVAALSVGLTGWPSARAQAMPSPSQGVLGIGDRTSGPLTIAASPAEKVASFATVPASALLTRPARMAKAPVPRLRLGPVSSAAAKAFAGGRWRLAEASWYGPGLYGNGMAGGGKLTRSSMIVAHKSLPFGTRVLVQWHGRAVVAEVRDRGPFVAGRDFDLGPGAARALGFDGVGTIRYRIL
jgi:hypothetical protein